MKQASIWAVTGWVIAFGALVACTLLFTGLAFESALEQQQINEILSTNYYGVVK